MINGLEGIPGSGKSYESTVFHVLPALQRGRKVITNLPLNVDMLAAIDPSYRDLVEIRDRPAPVRGTWDAERKQAYELFADGSTLPTEGSTFGTVWCFWSDWRHPVDQSGPLFIIDECHVPLPKLGTSAQVVEWFKLHRHFNCDVLLATQSFRDVSQPIASLLGVLIKCRKADILGKKDHYIRKVHGGYRGAVISSEERKYEPAKFALYKSHTQGLSLGESGATDVKPLLVKFNRIKWAWLACTAVALVWAFWPQGKPVPKAQPQPAAVPAMQSPAAELPNPPGAPTPGPAPAPGDPVPRSQAQAEPAPPASEKEPEPYLGKTIHITGWMRMGARDVYTFVVSASGQRIFDVQDKDLRRAGYAWEPISDCAGLLTWKGQTRPVTCDAPVLGSGANSRPVVIADGSRRSSLDH